MKRLEAGLGEVLIPQDHPPITSPLHFLGAQLGIEQCNAECISSLNVFKMLAGLDIRPWGMKWIFWDCLVRTSVKPLKLVVVLVSSGLFNRRLRLLNVDGH